MNNPMRDTWPVPESVIMQAEKLRHDGNDYYRRNFIGAAIDAYTEAIVLNPYVASSYTNRAQCYRKKKLWAYVEEDCRKAIELESSSLNGHYLLGCSLVERDDITEGIKELEKALDLGKAINPDDELIVEINSFIWNAKYKKWKHESNDRLWKLQDLRETCKSALGEQYINKFIPGLDEIIMEENAKNYTRHLKFLNVLFDEFEGKEKEAEIPDYLCCRISFEIYRDPVITPSGITYERSMVLDHLDKVGPFDPTTREPLEEHQLVPNLAIKEAVMAFLNQNGWAHRIE
ncbi:U-box domain protein [Zostera marina]|uniref:E3 ubiquitin-protein ligase CHIP n=1 Tax=Zostera marina TaxID=29655 RepID=A0A0K9NUT8_ZOSMR|nr:U-box domain protein [Zostera marina]